LLKDKLFIGLFITLMPDEKKGLSTHSDRQMENNFIKPSKTIT
jgi:hypothetical protein